MVIQYKCPNCGADMRFDVSSNRLKCDGCGNEMDIDKMPAPDIPEGSSSEDAPEVKPFNEADIDNSKMDENDIPIDENASAATFSESDAQNTVVYKCKNCGAEVITTKDTVSTNCSFCGAPVVIGERITGSLQPSIIIPFKISKENAQERFKKWCKGGKVTPGDFMTADRIKNISGMYVPFWLYDINGKGYADAICTKVRHYTSGNYDYTETQYFHVYRGFNMQYSKVPLDASEKMDDKLMDKIEPYNYDEAKKFNAPYLAGYLAEKYDFDSDKLMPRLTEKINRYIDSFVSSQFSGYSTVNYNAKNIDVVRRNTYYAMMPVWMVCYDYKDAEHIFAMNGETGKVVGKPPISKAKVSMWFGGAAACAFVVMRILTMLFGG